MLPKSPSSALRRLTLPASGSPARLSALDQPGALPPAQDRADDLSRTELAARLSVLLRWT